ncbi:MAG: cytochrome c family protein [Proteobacteria bacterium]|nr:cytochrome c family protein [Pseudomonadota bacterium]MBU4010084.1 cytochrome c family protein [Pseudomonadota bacterium]
MMKPKPSPFSGSKKIIVTVIMFTAFLLSAVFSHAEQLTEKLTIDRFVSAETCGDCHSTIYDQWQNSMHHLSHNDPLYVGVSRYMLSGLTDSDEIAESESCVKCHTPVGNITGYPEKTSDDRNKVAEIATKGIQCDYCHSATGADKMFNNGLIVSPGHGEDDPGIKRGPFKDSNSDYHQSAFSEFHTDAKICGTCHNVSHVSFGTKLETTYDEWKNGPYNNTTDEKQKITCQGCHMHQRPGIPATASTPRPLNKGRAADDGPIRDHIFTHYFTGANTDIPANFKTDEKRDMAIERLTHSADLALDTLKIKEGKLGIIVTNSGAGHYLPTGLTDVRQMWLEIVIKDEKKNIVFSSGKLDKDGYITQGTIIYNTVFGDGKGHPVLNISKAREILKDKRIPPKESVTEHIVFQNNNFKQLNISVRLLYRSAPQKLIDLVLGKGKNVLSVVTMKQIETTVNL